MTEEKIQQADSRHLAAGDGQVPSAASRGVAAPCGDAAPTQPEPPLGEFMGLMYVSRRACGRVSAACWDDPEHSESTAEFVAEWVKDGRSVERIERREGDQQPVWICNECRGNPCKEQPSEPQGREVPTGHSLTSGWIPVDERRPEIGTSCIVWIAPEWDALEPFAAVDRWDEWRESPVSFSSATVVVGEGWMESDPAEVTHWMPLPGAPTGQSRTFEAGEATCASNEPDEQNQAEFELHCDGEFAAGASGPRLRAWAEIQHYAAQYAQDGPVEIYEVKRTLVASQPTGERE